MYVTAPCIRTLYGMLKLSCFYTSLLLLATYSFLMWSNATLPLSTATLVLFVITL